MPGLVDHLLLVLSVAALGGAALRAAAALSARGLDLAVAAAAIGATAAGLEALALGLVGLGGSGPALALAAAATWMATRAGLEKPSPSVVEQMREAWPGLPLAGRLALGALAGAGLAWGAWLVRNPALGFDSVQYHIPEVVLWVQEGSPGANLPGVLEPVSNLPLMSEVLLAWQVGLAQSLVPFSLWAPAMLALLVSAGWLGLRGAGVGRRAAGLAVAAMAALPILTHVHQNGAYNDLPALTWLIVAAGLAVPARRNPRLLVAVLLAAGLAAGTKTTVLPLSALVVLAAFWPERSRLRELGRPLVAAALAALVVGGLWYLRDLLNHGSPFWPDVAAPWGDPTPVDAPSFLDRPRATLDRLLDRYLEVFAGGLLALGAALVAGVAVRDRAVRIGAAVTLGSLLLWLAAPATGLAESGSVVGTVSTLRYLLPAIAAATATLALATRGDSIQARLATIALGAVLAVNAIQTYRLGFPSVPGATVVLAGLVLGALAAAVLSPSRFSRGGPEVAWAAGALLALAAVVGLAVAAPGYLERHAKSNSRAVYPFVGMVAWLSSEESFKNGDAPVAMGPVPNGMTVGDRLEHRLEVIPAGEPCPRVRARLRDSWVLVSYTQLAGPSSAASCLASTRPAITGAGFPGLPAPHSPFLTRITQFHVTTSRSAGNARDERAAAASSAARPARSAAAGARAPAVSVGPMWTRPQAVAVRVLARRPVAALVEARARASGPR